MDSQVFCAKGVWNSWCVLTRMLKQTGKVVLLLGDLNRDDKNRAAGRGYRH